MNRQVESNLKLWYDSPANVWEEALPIGNGTLGGMVFGKPYVETIQLNEDSIWYGGPIDRNNPSALPNLNRIRELIFEGKINEAQELCSFALSGIPENQRHYEPLGNLYLLFEGQKEEYHSYRRELDLLESVVHISYEMNGVGYKRDIFASYPDQVCVIHLTASEEVKLNFHTQLARGHLTWDYDPYQTRIFRHPDYNNFIDN